jgi:hypothetical protein
MKSGYSRPILHQDQRSERDAPGAVTDGSRAGQCDTQRNVTDRAGAVACDRICASR